jgi:hypothetical protein
MVCYDIARISNALVGLDGPVPLQVCRGTNRLAVSHCRGHRHWRSETAAIVESPEMARRVCNE